MKLGEWLIHKNLISETQLLKGLARHVSSHEKLGECLVLEGFIAESTMLIALSEQLGFRYFDAIPIEHLTEKSMHVFPEHLAVSWCVVAGEEEGCLLVFFNDSQSDILEFLEGKTLEFTFALAKKSSIRDAIEKYGRHLRELDRESKLSLERIPGLK